METNIKELCSICKVKFNFYEKTTVTEIKDLLKFILIEKMNCELEDSPICQICLSKIREAHNFKFAYVDVVQKTLFSTVRGESDLDHCICQICRSVISSNECIPLFDSVTETGQSLIKYFAPKLELDMYEDFQSCEFCHKSLINFYNITNSLLLLNQEQVNAFDNVSVKKESLELEDMYNANDNFKMDTEEGTSDILEDVKENFEIEECTLKMENKDKRVEIEKPDQERERRTNDINFLDTNYFKTSHEGETFKCKICKHTTKCLDDLIKHMLSHKIFEVAIYKCQICKFETKDKYYFNQHQLLHKKSAEGEILQCENCDFKTKRKSNLNQHMLSHKNCDEVEMFLCINCDYVTKRKGDLKMHLLTHKNSTEIEMFKCKLCDFETKRKSSLKGHMLVHTSSDKVVMFNCKNCKYVSKRKSDLIGHMLVHKSSDEVEMFKCKYCEFKTKYRGNLRKHVLLHKNSEEIEMFKCNSCEFKTKYKRSFKGHMLLHKRSE